MISSAQYFVEKGEHCFRLAKSAVQPRVPRVEIASSLETLGYEFLAKAVEIETALQKIQRQDLSSR
jgi:hypothetical protein